LEWCALVTIGRAGSDFFQSLLDSHPEIFIFHGHFDFYNYWDNNSSCSKVLEEAEIEHLVDEFVGHFIWKLVSKYDKLERRNELGEDRNQSIRIDLHEFRLHMKSLLALDTVNSKNFLKAIYTSFSLCQNEDIFIKRLFFHHIHHILRLERYFKDCTQSKVIAMTRDPRALYVSGIEHWRKYNPETDHACHHFLVLNRTIQDLTQLKDFDIPFRVLKLEDLGRKPILQEVCNWLNISFHDTLFQTTCGGLRWWGDRLSTKCPDKEEKGFSSSIVAANKWENRLSRIDKLCLEGVIGNRISWYGYSRKYKDSYLLILLTFLLAPCPTIYEWRFFSLRYIMQCPKDRKIKYVLMSYYYYFKRVKLYYRKLFERVLGSSFDTPFFK
jgi:hypothetical protein